MTQIVLQTVPISSSDQFVAELIPSSVSVPLGSPMDETIECPEGKRIKLSLLTTTGNGENTNITVKSGTRTIMDSLTLRGETDTSSQTGFKVGSTESTSTIDFILGGVDEDININSNGANLTSIVVYAYQIGS